MWAIRHFRLFFGDSKSGLKNNTVKECEMAPLIGRRLKNLRSGIVPVWMVGELEKPSVKKLLIYRGVLYNSPDYSQGFRVFFKCIL